MKRNCVHPCVGMGASGLAAALPTDGRMSVIRANVFAGSAISPLSGDVGIFSFHCVVLKCQMDDESARKAAYEPHYGRFLFVQNEFYGNTGIDLPKCGIFLLGITRRSVGAVLLPLLPGFPMDRGPGLRMGWSGYVPHI